MSGGKCPCPLHPCGYGRPRRSGLESGRPDARSGLRPYRVSVLLMRGTRPDAMSADMLTTNRMTREGPPVLRASREHPLVRTDGMTLHPPTLTSGTDLRVEHHGQRSRICACPFP